MGQGFEGMLFSVRLSTTIFIISNKIPSESSCLIFEKISCFISSSLSSDNPQDLTNSTCNSVWGAYKVV